MNKKKNYNRCDLASLYKIESELDDKIELHENAMEALIDEIYDVKLEIVRKKYGIKVGSVVWSVGWNCKMKVTHIDFDADEPQLQGRFHFAKDDSFITEIGEWRKKK